MKNIYRFTIKVGDKDKMSEVWESGMRTPIAGTQDVSAQGTADMFRELAQHLLSYANTFDEMISEMHIPGEGTNIAGAPLLTNAQAIRILTNSNAKLKKVLDAVEEMRDKCDNEQIEALFHSSYGYTLQSAKAEYEAVKIAIDTLNAQRRWKH